MKITNMDNKFFERKLEEAFLNKIGESLMKDNTNNNGEVDMNIFFGNKLSIAIVESDLRVKNIKMNSVTAEKIPSREIKMGIRESIGYTKVFTETPIVIDNSLKDNVVTIEYRDEFEEKMIELMNKSFVDTLRPDIIMLPMTSFKDEGMDKMEMKWSGKQNFMENVIKAFKNKKVLVLDGKFRGVGKTTLLANMSAEFNIPVLVNNSGHKSILKRENENAKIIYKNDIKEGSRGEILLDSCKVEEVEELRKKGITPIGFVQFDGIKEI